VASDGHALVFLPAGSAGCSGAAASFYGAAGDTVGAAAITIRLDAIGGYKLCHALVNSPTFDSQFAFVAGVLLVVGDVSPPPSPSPPSPMVGIYIGGAVGAVLLLGGIALAVVCVCKKKKLPTATVTATTHSVEMKSAPDRDDKSIHESGDKI